MTILTKNTELLAPCGSLNMLETAFRFGASAVYAGQPRYSLRVRNNEFGKIEKLAQGIERAHELGHFFYVVSNIIPHNSKIKTYLTDMQEVINLKPDALIMSDPGLIAMVQETWPEMVIHLSVQANTVNYQSVKFWQKVGVKRIILSRELSLDEIQEIRQECPEMELEVFVHGALCMAHSGRCLLSGYLNHRDPNQGSCTNSCRWDYDIHQTNTDPSGDVYLLEEKQRPGELIPIEEDEHGTYIMNSKDLRALEHVQKLVDMGVDSLKIEGRTKSAYYVARTCQVYRQAIDDARAGRPLDPRLLGQLDGLANRGYTSGFYERHPDQDYQNYLQGHSESDRSQYVGDILNHRPDGWAHILVKNKFQVGDLIEVIHPAGNFDWRIEQMQNREGQSIDVAPGSGHEVFIPIPTKADQAFIARYL